MAPEESSAYCQLGPVCFQVREADGRSILVPETDPHAAFLVSQPAEACRVIPLTVVREEIPRRETGVPDAAPCFVHRGGWQLFRAPGPAPETGYWAILPIPAGSDSWHRAIRILPKEVTLFIPPDKRYEDHPLGLLTTELLWLTFLEWVPGLLLHAAGVQLDRGVFLFTGPSGSGKSTTAGLWEKAGRGEVMADESIMVWEQEGKLIAGGSPWPGQGMVFSFRSGPILRVHQLTHGTSNEMTPLLEGQAAAEILSHTFMPHWSRSALEKTTLLASRIAAEIPMCRFSFLPDIRAVDAVLAADSGSAT